MQYFKYLRYDSGTVLIAKSEDVVALRLREEREEGDEREREGRGGREVDEERRSE